MTRGYGLLLLLALIAMLSTATYGEMYKSLDDAQCVADPRSKCIIQVSGRRGLWRRCDCTPGYSCQYRPYDASFVCSPERLVDSDVRKIFF